MSRWLVTVGVVMLFILPISLDKQNQPWDNFALSNNPQTIFLTIPPNSYTTTYAAHQEVTIAPCMYHLILHGEPAGAFGFLMNQSEYQNWLPVRPDYPPRAFDYFDLNQSIDFTMPFYSNDDYYIVFYNRVDESVTVTGEWLVDEWAPVIDHNLEDGMQLQGPVTVIANASDHINPLFVAMLIDGIVVANETGPNLEHLWETTDYPEGRTTVTFVSNDWSGNLATEHVEVIIDNIPDPTSPDDGRGSVVPDPLFLIFLIGLVVIVGITISHVATRLSQKPDRTQADRVKKGRKKKRKS